MSIVPVSNQPKIYISRPSKEIVQIDISLCSKLALARLQSNMRNLEYQIPGPTEVSNWWNAAAPLREAEEASQLEWIYKNPEIWIRYNTGNNDLFPEHRLAQVVNVLNPLFALYYKALFYEGLDRVEIQSHLTSKSITTQRLKDGAQSRFRTTGSPINNPGFCAAIALSFNHKVLSYMKETPALDVDADRLLKIAASLYHDGAGLAEIILQKTYDTKGICSSLGLHSFNESTVQASGFEDKLKSLKIRNLYDTNLYYSRGANGEWPDGHKISIYKATDEISYLMDPNYGLFKLTPAQLSVFIKTKYFDSPFGDKEAVFSNIILNSELSIKNRIEYEVFKCLLMSSVVIGCALSVFLLTKQLKILNLENLFKVKGSLSLKSLESLFFISFLMIGQCIFLQIVRSKKYQDLLDIYYRTRFLENDSLKRLC